MKICIMFNNNNNNNSRTFFFAVPPRHGRPLARWMEDPPSIVVRVRVRATAGRWHDALEFSLSTWHRAEGFKGLSVYADPARCRTQGTRVVLFCTSVVCTHTHTHTTVGFHFASRVRVSTYRETRMSNIPNTITRNGDRPNGTSKTNSRTVPIRFE